MTWKQLTERDRREWKLSAIDPHDIYPKAQCKIWVFRMLIRVLTST